MVKKVKNPVNVKRGRASKNKGKRGERELAHMLTARGYQAKRGVQYKGGLNSPDVICEDLEFLHFEAKWVEKLNVYNAYLQAKGDAGMEKVPVVVHKQNRKEVLVTMSFLDWISLVQCVMGDKDSLNSVKRLVDEQRTRNRERTAICDLEGQCTVIERGPVGGEGKEDYTLL